MRTCAEHDDVSDKNKTSTALNVWEYFYFTQNNVRQIIIRQYFAYLPLYCNVWQLS